MIKTLHILNGDGTAAPFQQSNLKEDDTLIWREVMMEGPVDYTQQDFWQKREVFLAQRYKRYEEDMPNYREMVMQEKAKLDVLAQYDELVLWFEYDLFCQINLLFLLRLLSDYDVRQLRLSLVSPGQEQEGKHFHGMGEGTPRKIEMWYEQRVELSSAALKEANHIWNDYTEATPKSIMALVSKGNIKHFPHLQKALLAHLSRFPSFKNGLNTPEQALLNIIAEQKPKKFGQLFQSFWKQYPIYGFGDAQLVNYLAQMSPLLVQFDKQLLASFTADDIIQFEGTIELTELGKEMREGKCDWLEYIYPNEWLGGVHLVREKPLFRWEAD